MLFHVKMTVNLPLDMPAERAASLTAEEKARAQRLPASAHFGATLARPLTRVGAQSNA